MIIELPEELKFSGKEIIITIEDVSESKITNIELMKKAANDPLFLKDIEDTTTDFEFSDFE